MSLVPNSSLWVQLETAGVITRRALHLPDEISEAEMVSLGTMFSDIDDTTRFLLGDLLVTATARYGSDFTVEVMEATGLAFQTCANMESVCRRVLPNVRRDELRFYTHAVVAPLPPSEQKKMLGLAVKNSWTRQQLRDEINGGPVLPRVVSDDLPTLVSEAISGAREMMDGWLISRDSYVRLRAAVDDL